jgi:hypothetical protein
MPACFQKTAAVRMVSTCTVTAARRDPGQLLLVRRLVEG